MSLLKNLDTIVFYHRRRAGYTRKQLADLAGVGKTVIYDLENGKETIQWATIVKILKVLNIKITFDSPIMDVYQGLYHR